VRLRQAGHGQGRSHTGFHAVTQFANIILDTVELLVGVTLRPALHRLDLTYGRRIAVVDTRRHVGNAFVTRIDAERGNAGTAGDGQARSVVSGTVALGVIDHHAAGADDG